MTGPVESLLHRSPGLIRPYCRASGSSFKISDNTLFFLLQPDTLDLQVRFKSAGVITKLVDLVGIVPTSSDL